MTLFNNKYYIIRIGDFATNGNKKIFYSMFSTCLCIEEYLSTNSLDCFRIMIGSTLVWTLIEIFLNKTNTRVIKPMYVTDFYGNSVKIPKYLGIFLQGFQEGGVVTTFGLYFGDRLNNYNYMMLFHLFIFYIMVNVLLKENGIEYTRNKVKPIKTFGMNKQIYNRVSSRVVQTTNASKRQINTSASIGIMSYISFYNAITLYNNPEHFMRQANMFLAMIYVCSIWTIIAYYKNFRKVEIEIMREDGEYVSKKPTFIDTFLILGYDVIFEIGIAYITFYNWFIM